MIQRMTIDIDSRKPLASYGDGHILVFDKEKNYYFIVTREDFLREQNNKIKLLDEQLKKLLEKVNGSLKEFEEKEKKFFEESENKYNNFLIQYKETNEKMIKLIKTLTVSEEA